MIINEAIPLIGDVLERAVKCEKFHAADVMVVMDDMATDGEAVACIIFAESEESLNKIMLRISTASFDEILSDSMAKNAIIKAKS